MLSNLRVHWCCGPEQNPKGVLRREAKALPFDLGREVAQQSLVGRVPVERGRSQDQSRGNRLHGAAGEIAGGGELGAFGVPLDAHPIVERLQRQVHIFGRLDLYDAQAIVTIDG